MDSRNGDPGCWWFGIKETLDPQGNLWLARIGDFLNGWNEELAWTRQGGHRPGRDLEVGDRVLFWMEDLDSGGDHGVVGFAYVSRIEPAVEGPRYILRRDSLLERSLSPPPDFLTALFQEHRRAVSNSEDLDRAGVTVIPMKPWQYEALVDRSVDWAA